MIALSIRTREGLPVRIEAHGHASAGSGALSAPCAAVSVLLKSLGGILVDHPSCAVRGSVSEPGAFILEIEGCRDQAWLRGVGDLLRCALQEVARSWPEEVCFSTGEVSESIFSGNEENSDGT